MATSKQEHLYSEIVEYYNFADELIDTIKESKENIPEAQIEIVEKIVENLEKYADLLSSQFIEFIRNGNREEIVDSLRSSLDGVMEQIEKCRSQLFNIYNKASS